MKARLRIFKNPKKALAYLKKIQSETSKSTKFFWNTLVVIVSFLRLIIPVFIFIQPLFVFIIFAFLDNIDVVPMTKAGFKFKKYQLIDKFLDLNSQFFMMLYGLQTEYFIFFLLLFSYRLLGTILFFVTNKHLFLLIFPNLIEVIFLAYVLSLFFNLKLLTIFVILFILKIIQEIYLHASIFQIPLGTLKIEIGQSSFQVEIMRSV